MRRICEDDYGVKIYEDDYHIIVITGCSLCLGNEDDNVDVEIVLNNGKRYSGTIFTIKNIQSLMENYKQTGECCHGLFFGGCKDIVLVETLSLEIIARVIQSVYKTGDMETVFNPLE